jgi:hypothetical protein
MKKTLLLIPIVAMLAACGTTDKYGKMAEQEREYRVKSAEKIIDKAPKWCDKLPESASAVYECGFGSSFNKSDSLSYASNEAYGIICMTAGGRTSQQTKMYSSEGERSRTQVNERATKSSCPSVDLTGVRREKVEQFVTADGKINTYVLVALPTGDANILKRAKEAHAERELALKRAPEAFKELDKQ